MRARSNAGHLALGALAAALTLGSAQQAEAYCRTSVCESEFAGTQCVPSQIGDCGFPLFWDRDCFGVSLQRDASNQVGLETVRSIVQLAFGAWQTADCGGGQTPGIGVQLDEDVRCDEVEYNQSGGNANIVMFRDDAWPHQGMGNTLALTTVTYNLDTAAIFDADMEVNSTPTVNLTVSDTDVEFDLLSIMTHEAGHMLGLAHSERDDATMAAEYQPGDISIRTLSDDDVSAICAAYPPKNLTDCDIEPRHGFKSSCGGEEEDDGCGCEVAGQGPNPLGLGALGALMGLVLLRRRRD